MKVNRRLLIAAIGICALLAAATQYMRPAPFDEADYFRDLDEVARIRRFDKSLEVDVLRSRLGIHPDYDPLAASVAELEGVLAEMESDSHDELYAKTAELSAARANLKAAIAAKTAIAERFKSANSILRNSLSVVPGAVADAYATLPIAGSDAERTVRDAIGRLVVAALLQAQGASGDSLTGARIDLGRIDASMYALSPASRERMETLVIHFRTLIEGERAVDELMTQVASIDIAARANAVTDLLHQEHQIATSAENDFRTFLIAVSMLLSVLFIGAAIQVTRAHVQIGRMNRELRQANDSLEQRVETRTQELAAAQEELVAAARSAGMAEIATNVLHNVGNILNSVNVSVNVLASSSRQSRIASLARTVELLDRHSGDLGRFVTEDDRGRMLPAFLRELSMQLERERNTALRELEHLTTSVDHIKTIVTPQQSYAMNKPMLAPVHVGELIEDALRISGCQPADANLLIVRSYDEVPVMRLERDSVLQILVNLIGNARHAMRAKGAERTRMVLRMSLSEDALQVSVIDDGEGISRQDLTRIFSHGFTTRKNGHGFGLHSCAIAARRLGGTLTAKSDGPGQGAEFTLRLPLHAQEAVA